MQDLVSGIIDDDDEPNSDPYPQLKQGANHKDPNQESSQFAKGTNGKQTLQEKLERATQEMLNSKEEDYDSDERSRD